MRFCFRWRLQFEGRHGRVAGLFGHGEHGSEHHFELGNAGAEMLGDVLLEPHRAEANRADDVAWDGADRSDSAIQRLRLHDVQHDFGD